MKKYKVGFIGAGNMAQAIISGLLGSNNYTSKDLFVFDISDSRKKFFSNQNIDIARNSLEIVNQSEIVFLAIKPQNYETVLNEIKSAVTIDTTFVTIAAGISMSYIQNRLDVKCPIVRAMPNTPLLMSCGATAICASENIKDSDFNKIKAIFEVSSEVQCLSENQMNDIIAVNGSSPAYLYLFVKAVVDWAVSKGIDYDVAMSLICKTLEGSALMLKNSGSTPDELIKMVSSPGGTTLAALSKLEEHDFYGSIIDAMDSCSKRANELSS